MFNEDTAKLLVSKEVKEHFDNDEKFNLFFRRFLISFFRNIRLNGESRLSSYYTYDIRDIDRVDLRFDYYGDDETILVSFMHDKNISSNNFVEMNILELEGVR
jgi:hypothetical protein